MFYSCVIVSRYWFWFNGYNILICFMYMLVNVIIIQDKRFKLVNIIMEEKIMISFYYSMVITSENDVIVAEMTSFL